MKAIVDPGICIGCALCSNICPEVFVMDGDVAIVKGENVPAETIDSCKEAADTCPVTAIALQP